MSDFPKMQVAEQIPGYTYGTDAVVRSPVTLDELERLKQSVGWTEEDEYYRRLAGEVLADQTEALVQHWRAVIAAHPHLAQYSLSPDGGAIPHYSHDSGLRFQQWVLDTCLRPYDQDWLNYQQEIALRHTSLKKNTTDRVESAPFIPLRYILAFAAVINETTKPYLAARGGSAEEVDKMHRAWCKSVQLQVTLWSQPYTSTRLAPNEW
jgi:hypothetical protein